MSSDWIRRALKSAGLTQTEIAKRSGVDRSYVSHQLSGSREMTFDVAKVLAEALRVSEAEVLHRAGVIGSELPPVPVVGRVGEGGRVEWYSAPSRHVVSPVRGAESDAAIEDRSGGALDGGCCIVLACMTCLWIWPGHWLLLIFAKALLSFASYQSGGMLVRSTCLGDGFILRIFGLRTF